MLFRSEAYNLLVNYKRPGQNKQHNNEQHRNNKTPATANTANTKVEDANDVTETPDLSFVQQDTSKPLNQVVCYNCQQLGHYSNVCNNPTVPRVTTGIQHVQFATEVMYNDANDNESEEYDDESHFQFYHTHNRDDFGYEEYDDESHFQIYQTHFVHHQARKRGSPTQLHIIRQLLNSEYYQQ